MELKYAKVQDGVFPVVAYNYQNPFIYDGNIRDLQELVNNLLEMPSILDMSHIEEGVVLRIEQPDGTIRFIKQKSFAFGVLEGYMKLDDNYVDTEEAVSGVEETG